MAPDQQPPGYPQPGYPAQGYLPPGYPPPGYPPPGYPPPGYPTPWQPGQGGFFPDPGDPLVSADFPGWWTKSLALIKAAWRPMVLVQLAAVFPLLAAGVIALLIWEGDILTTTPATGPVAFDGDAFVAGLWWAVPAGLLGSLWVGTVQLAMSQLLIQSALGRPFSIPAALLAGLRRLLPLTGWYLLALPLVLVGLICCILPGYYVAAVLSLLPSVVLVERGKGIGRCFQLFNANFGVALGRVVTIVAASGFLSNGLTLLAGAFSGGNLFNPDGLTTTGAVAIGLVSALVSVVLGVATPAFVLTTYADLRARHEPFTTADLASP